MYQLSMSQPLYTEERYCHEECGDTRDRLYVKRIPRGWLLHCFNCGWSTFKPSDTNNLSDLKERLNARLYIKGGSSSQQVSLSLPHDFCGEIPTTGILWLNKYNISQEDARRYRLGYSEKLNRLILPLYDEQGQLIFWQGRGLAKPTKDFPKYLNMRGPKGKYAVFKGQADPLDSVCLVEDILSAIKVRGSGMVDSIPLLGSHIANNLLPYLNPYGKIYLWLDYDKRFESIKYSQRIRTLTGKPCHSIITELDPKEYSCAEICGYLKERKV